MQQPPASSGTASLRPVWKRKTSNWSIVFVVVQYIAILVAFILFAAHESGEMKKDVRKAGPPDSLSVMKVASKEEPRELHSKPVMRKRNMVEEHRSNRSLNTKKALSRISQGGKGRGD
ncbi:hypothetical protein GUITHDRAFT_112772 [Guillardia theta CCMP2712]|uniref:Uncharacterized protein n=2 Tax=Guillardia theta TaxID=55529 RepID=L1IYQ4_GUITC|nr:hypothetical protein GUITHDRAFT_112772 [Guillardia theta CCMP2712]EKX41034.1 hypothetical protein GUITHDRAFT_112772 [Guillardia theta CCMP2712]|eukprot:XP_005828014.1 hypothetical protein GUITHDRAFT_112772 [Guillardia theta CCMP2712]